jgi:hypothetical protein
MTLFGDDGEGKEEKYAVQLKVGNNESSLEARNLL